MEPLWSASDVTTLWRYTNLFIIIIIKVLKSADHEEEQQRHELSNEPLLLRNQGRI